MAFPARDSDLSLEDYYREHEQRFTAYVRRRLGSEREGAGGRVGVEDTLQEALEVAHRRWSDFRAVDSDERDRRMYQCLQDAAGTAVRKEHGRYAEAHGRPRVISYDFGLLHSRDLSALPARERDLTASVLGAMAADLAAAAPGSHREALDVAVLMAGLRALNESEQVALVADLGGYKDTEIAEGLDLSLGAARTVLFEARRVFYGLIRHAIQIDLDEAERNQLHAYIAGDLSGRERRIARRHLQHCTSCQKLKRELERFTDGARTVLTPLPFVVGGRLLKKKAPAKAAAVGVGGAGLFAQAGAAKALGVTVAFLSVGVGVTAWVAENSVAPPHGDEVAPRGSLVVQTSLGTVRAFAPASRAKAEAPPKKKKAASRPARRQRARSRRQPLKTSTVATPQAPAQTQQQQQQPAATSPVAPVAPPPASSPSSSGSSSSGGTKKSSGSGSGVGGGEFFAG